MYIYQFIKGCEKDTDEQLDEKVHRVKSGKVPSAGISVPVDWGVLLSQYGCVQFLEAL